MAIGRDHTSAPLTRAGLEALYIRLEKPMYNVVYRWLWNAADAHDVVQEAFCRLWRARDRVDMATVEPLAYKIAVNLASNRRRSRRLWQWVSWDRAPAQSSDSPLAGESLDARERRAAVRAAIDGLPERHRKVVVLCELSGMSYGQVAETLGVAIGTVASRRHTALKTLRRSLSGLFAEDDDHEPALETTGF